MRIAMFLVALSIPNLLWAGEEAGTPDPARYEGKTSAEWAGLLTAEDVASRKKAAYALWSLGSNAGDAALPLVQAIRDTDAYVRGTSAKAVERLGAAAVKTVLPEIASEILDTRQEVRREAVTLLFRLGPLSREVVPGLVKGLASADPVVRANAAAALGNAEEAAKPAAGEIAKLLGDKDEAVRAWSAKALARIDPPAAFASERPEVRLAALQHWGGMFVPEGAWKRPEIVEGVLRCTKDRVEEVRGSAVHALDNFAVFAGPQAPKAWMELFREVLEKEKVPAIRATGAFGLARFRQHAAEVIPLLAAATDCDEPEVERTAILALGWFGEKARHVVPAILAAFKDGDPETRDATPVALSTMGDRSEPVIAVLVQVLKSGTHFGPRNAAKALGILGGDSPVAIKALAAVVVDPEEDYYLRWDAARALGKIGGTEALAALTSWFEKDPETPADVAGSLCVLGSPLAPKAVARLAALATDPENPYPSAAIVWLKDLGPKAVAATSTLATLLSSKDPRIRIGAAEALKAIGPGAKEALPALEAAAKDGDAAVAAAARGAMEALQTAPGTPK